MRNGYYVSMRLIFCIGLLLIVCAFFLAAAEAAWYGMPGSVPGLIVSAYDLWYTLSPSSLIIFEIRVERMLGFWVWDPVLVTIMELPAWLIFGTPGVILLIFFRPNRDPKSIEDMAKVMESYELYDHLTKLAREENPPGEEHGPRDILPDYDSQGHELGDVEKKF